MAELLQTEENSLICSTDIFSTIAASAGVNVAEIHDSKSFQPLSNSAGDHRDFQYSEMNDGTVDLWTISNGAFKLIVNANGNEEMYDLLNDPFESNNLLNATLTTNAESAKIELAAEMSIIRN